MMIKAFRMTYRTLCSFVFCMAVVCTGAHADSPPVVSAASWLVLDGQSGKILAGKNIDERRSPASLTKLMTAYVVLEAIKQGELDWDERVPVSASDIGEVANDEARMYLTAGQQVAVRDLVRGLIVASANDAAEVLAHRVGSNVAGFARRMNDTARRLGMKDTHFVTPSGVTTPDHYTTARDLSKLALRLTLDFPEYYSFSSQPYFSYGHFKKRNKNALLAIDPSFDGLKTGHTKAALWCIVATAKRKEAESKIPRRIFAVVLGAPSDRERIASARALVEYGFRAGNTARPDHS